MADHGSSLRVKGYIIDRELFERGFPAGGNGPCRCSSTCCEGGVYADVTERDRILAHRGLITPHMDATQTPDATLWFEDAESRDADFCSGRCIGTRILNDKCAFLDRLGRCSLQVAATAAGMHMWALKPLYCVLYPVGVAGRVVLYDDVLHGEQECCSARQS